MKAKIQLPFILLTVAVALAEDFDYCAFDKCPDGSHTLCLYPDPGLSSSCIDGTESLVLNDSYITTIVDCHNNFSQPLVTFEVREFLGTLEDEPPTLKWDGELALAAQRWVDQCLYAVDTCRNVERFDVYQRVGVERTYQNHGAPSVNQIIFKWYVQDGLYDMAHVDLTGLRINEAAESSSRFLTRRVWGNAEYVGCGAIQSTNNLIITVVLACNYAPV